MPTLENLRRRGAQARVRVPWLPTDERQRRLRVAIGAGIVLSVGLAWVLSLRTVWLLGASLLVWLGPLGNADALATIFDQPILRWSPAIGGVS